MHGGGCCPIPNIEAVLIQPQPQSYFLHRMGGGGNGAFLPQAEKHHGGSAPSCLHSRTGSYEFLLHHLPQQSICHLLRWPYITWPAPRSNTAARPVSVPGFCECFLLKENILTLLQRPATVYTYSASDCPRPLPLPIKIWGIPFSCKEEHVIQLWPHCIMSYV